MSISLFPDPPDRHDLSEFRNIGIDTADCAGSASSRWIVRNCSSCEPANIARFGTQKMQSFPYGAIRSWRHMPNGHWQPAVTRPAGDTQFTVFLTAVPINRGSEPTCNEGRFADGVPTEFFNLATPR